MLSDIHNYKSGTAWLGSCNSSAEGSRKAIGLSKEEDEELEVFTNFSFFICETTLTRYNYHYMRDDNNNFEFNNTLMILSIFYLH